MQQFKFHPICIGNNWMKSNRIQLAIWQMMTVFIQLPVCCPTSLSDAVPPGQLMTAKTQERLAMWGPQVFLSLTHYTHYHYLSLSSWTCPHCHVASERHHCSQSLWFHIRKRLVQGIARGQDLTASRKASWHIPSLISLMAWRKVVPFWTWLFAVPLLV